MADRRFKLLVLWNVVLSVIVLISLGANAVLAHAASDPPVKVFAANADDADLNGDSGKIVIDTNSNKRVMSVALDLPDDHPEYCIAVASLEVQQPKLGGRYQVALGWENGTFTYSSIREMQFDDATAATRSQKTEVTTVFVHKLKPGNHTISLLGRKWGDQMPSLEIAKTAMFAICMQQPPTTP